MQQGLISFIIPNRGGFYLPEVVANINEVYGKYEKEIIIVEQCDSEGFKKGQLYNIALKLCNGEYVALQDNDIIHFREIKVLDVLKRNDMSPYLGFTHISQIPSPQRPYVITRSEKCLLGYGGFLFGSLESFTTANGFSNLYIGWGSEDNDLSRRLTTKILANGYGDIYRIKQDLGHITHPQRGKLSDLSVIRNKNIFLTRDSRDIQLDGLRQTVYTLVSDETNGNVRIIKVKDITVPNDFAYKNLL